MTETDEIDMLKASAADENAQLETAFRDCVAALSLFALDGRSTRDAVGLLSNWTNTFQKLHASNLLVLAGKARR